MFSYRVSGVDSVVILVFYDGIATGLTVGIRPENGVLHYVFEGRVGTKHITDPSFKIYWSISNPFSGMFRYLVKGGRVLLSHR